jgi:hypothetical protein
MTKTVTPPGACFGRLATKSTQEKSLTPEGVSYRLRTVITTKKGRLDSRPFLSGFLRNGQKVSLAVIWAILMSVAADANAP